MKKLILCILLLCLTAAAADLPERFVITLEIRQGHFTLNVVQHIKDAANAIKIEIPVDKQFYDDVQVGTVLNDKFRTASLLLSGSWGSWKVKVIEKKIIPAGQTPAPQAESRIAPTAPVAPTASTAK